jgi:transcriptional regulator with XRE-family HTH domain
MLQHMDKKSFQTQLGNKVRLYRKSLTLSQEQLAEVADVHPTFISNIERGKVSVSAFYIYKISDALGVRIVDLLDFQEGNEEDSDLRNDLLDISARIRNLEHSRRNLIIAAIKGMLINN